MRRHTSKEQGFTIVELLIVIVVIGVLASITVVAFSGVSQRGQNAARVSVAKSAYNVIKIYTTTAGSDEAIRSAIPANGAVCYGKGLPDVNGDGIGDCVYNVALTNVTSYNATVDALLQSTGSYGVINYPVVTNAANGAKFLAPMIFNLPSYTVDDRAAPLWLLYVLQGVNQDCGLRTIVYVSGTNWTASNSNNYSSSSSTTNITQCYVDMSYQ